MFLCGKILPELSRSDAKKNGCDGGRANGSRCVCTQDWLTHPSRRLLPCNSGPHSYQIFRPRNEWLLAEKVRRPRPTSGQRRENRMRTGRCPRHARHARQCGQKSDEKEEIGRGEASPQGKEHSTFNIKRPTSKRGIERRERGAASRNRRTAAVCGVGAPAATRQNSTDVELGHCMGFAKPLSRDHVCNRLSRKVGVRQPWAQQRAKLAGRREAGSFLWSERCSGRGGHTPAISRRPAQFRDGSLVTETNSVGWRLRLAPPPLHCRGPS